MFQARPIGVAEKRARLVMVEGGAPARDLRGMKRTARKGVGERTLKARRRPPKQRKKRAVFEG